MDTGIDLAAVLSHFPGPVTLYPARRTWLRTAAGCCVLAILALWAVVKGNGAGWAFVAIFGTGAVAAVVALAPGAGLLTLNKDGFEARSLFRSTYGRWRETRNFEVVVMPRSKLRMVFYDDTSAALGIVTRASVLLFGHNARLPDTYGLSADGLAELMSQWRSRVLR